MRGSEASEGLWGRSLKDRCVARTPCLRGGKGAELGDRGTNRTERDGLRKADFSTGVALTRVPRECLGPPNGTRWKVGEPMTSPLKR